MTFVDRQLVAPRVWNNLPQEHVDPLQIFGDKYKWHA